MNRAHRLLILAGMFLATMAALLFVDPIPQDPAYHLFADTRPCLGIPNCGDVVSNAGFSLAGLLGLWGVLGPRGRRRFAVTADAIPYAVFFFGVFWVGAGSAYYHLNPTNATLFWDRLPMTVAFMALFSAIIADRIDRRAGIWIVLPFLLVCGAGSLFYWEWTEARGLGDLRFYGLVQFYPMLALPVICWLFPKARYTGGGFLVWIIFWYGVAKVLEHFDVALFELLGGTISGHSLKHLAAAMATFMVWRMVRQVPGTRPPAREPGSAAG